MNKYQLGSSLVEVLVALLLLSVAVLGFAALQIRAVSASVDAGNNIQAVNLARDLAERIRINREGFDAFESRDGYSASISATTDCSTSLCAANDMALYDFTQVNAKATQLGMSMSIRDCQGSSLKRKCIYVAWGNTTPTNGTGDLNCTNGTAYVTGAQCIIFEAYNYE